MKAAKFRRVVFQPSTSLAMQRGINQMANTVRPTLGPLPRYVAIEQNPRSKIPELIDNGGLILRRIVALQDRDADIGAMLIRHVLWQVYETVGDGTATAAVLFQSIYNQGVQYLMAGGNAMQLRGSLEEGMQVILKALEKQTVSLKGKKALSQVAESICSDPPLANMLGEIFDIVGEYGQLEIRAGHSLELEREYVEGAYWRGQVHTNEMIRDHSRLRTDLHDAAILISDLEIEDPYELIPALDLALKAGIRRVLVLAQKLSEKVIALMSSASRDPEKFLVVASKIPGTTLAEQAALLHDIATTTGGRPVFKAAGESLEGIRLEDLGRARKVWLEKEHFGISGGRGDARKLRAYLTELCAAFARAGKKETRDFLQQRIGKLMSGSATLFVGGTNENVINLRKEQAERTAQTLRVVMREGVVPGGGASLLACRSALRERLGVTREADERAAYVILLHAVEAPFRTILTNAGYEPSRALAEIDQERAGNGFDVRSGCVAEMDKAGIWDAAAVVKEVVYSAVAGAALALTTDVLVHHKKPEMAVNP